MEKARNIVRTLNFRKSKFQFFKELVSKTPWETFLRDRGAEQSWQIFKDAFHRAQEPSVPKYKRSVKVGKGPAWLSQDLLVKLKGKGNCIGSGSRDRYPGKSMGMLPGCVGMGSGGTRHG